MAPRGWSSEAAPQGEEERPELQRKLRAVEISLLRGSQASCTNSGHPPLPLTHQEVPEFPGRQGLLVVVVQGFLCFRA